MSFETFLALRFTVSAVGQVYFMCKLELTNYRNLETIISQRHEYAT